MFKSSLLLWLPSFVFRGQTLIIFSHVQLLVIGARLSGNWTLSIKYEQVLVNFGCFLSCLLSDCKGIPVAQQHLIWNNLELDDEHCLHDYG